MSEELAALVAAARALVEDAALRGVREVERAPAIASPASPTRVPEVRAAPAVPSAAPVRAEWFALAADARAEELPKAARLERVREELGDCRRCNLCKER